MKVGTVYRHKTNPAAIWRVARISKQIISLVSGGGDRRKTSIYGKDFAIEFLEKFYIKVENK